MKVIKFLDDHLEEILLCILLCVITFNTCLQTIMRYVFNHALSWTDELSKWCFIYSGFISIGYCIKKHLMVRIDIIKTIIPEKAFNILSAFVTVIVLVFLVLIFKASLVTFKDYYEGEMISPSMGLSMHYLYFSAILGTFLGIIRCIQSLITYDIPLCFGKEVKM